MNIFMLIKVLCCGSRSDHNTNPLLSKSERVNLAKFDLSDL